ncbi:hypothetical protein HETIRDRAFT_167166 [Heterobasidion irregulare TC 32-1]|uniref:Uncharacterized protein n=1 Tax=Heterobasidion irregulare (strain TC 32-1) TaxID=747525 RepID=W4KPG8_HETIT|nr:uncharacterized protein HETIRDRAFT_167166 [Heterobasidion irregulare TC 32-1]ETW87599.1 hypothetical protein HETIRDRAFT_167166 [Heterobasidion irregulare TC 32-1]
MWEWAARADQSGPASELDKITIHTRCGNLDEFGAPRSMLIHIRSDCKVLLAPILIVLLSLMTLAKTIEMSQTTSLSEHGPVIPGHAFPHSLLSACKSIQYVILSHLSAQTVLPRRFGQLP